jgi:hypothetical protein
MSAAVAGAMLAGSAAWAQKYTAPRAPWDNSHPDLSGIWQAKPNVGDDIEKYIVGGPKKIPYLPGKADQVKTNFTNRAKEDPVNKCYMPGVPRLMYMNYPLQIFQSPKYIVVVSEYSHTDRPIYMDGSPHVDYLPFWMGDSRGHWDGDTLVVDVLSFNDQTWLDKAGNYHSDQLHVVERYTRTGPTTLDYEATISDPKVFSKEWKIKVPLTLDTKPNARLMEYECQDKAPIKSETGQ